MNQAVSSIAHIESDEEIVSTEYNADECIKRYETIINSDPILYESYELNDAAERIENRFLPYQENLSQNVNREIVTRIHGDASVQSLYAIIDSISLQNVPDTNTLFTIHAHNLNDETLQKAYEISQKARNCIRIINTQNPDTAGAYYSWQIAMLQTKGKNIAMVDSDGYALPEWSNSMFKILEDDPTLAGASGNMIKINGSFAYNAAQTLRPLIKGSEGSEFRSGNSVFKGEAARRFAYKNAGRLREDGSFAYENRGHIAYTSESLVINNAEKFAELSVSDTFQHGLYKVRRNIADRNPNSVDTIKLKRQMGESYLRRQTVRYAPWVKPFIDVYDSNSGIVRLNDLKNLIVDDPEVAGVRAVMLKDIFEKITKDGEVTDPSQFISLLDEIGAQVYSSIIRSYTSKE